MKVNTTRRNVFAGLALAAVLGTTGCSVVNPQATTFQYAPSDGTQTSVYETENSNPNAGVVKFLNIGVITNSADEAGRVMGTIHNSSTEPQSVSLKINNQSFQFSMDADEILNLEDENLTMPQVGTEPGQLASGEATAFGTTNEFNVSVLAPTLEEYRELYPGEFNQQEQTEHLTEFQGPHHRDEQ